MEKHVLVLYIIGRETTYNRDIIGGERSDIWECNACGSKFCRQILYREAHVAFYPHMCQSIVCSMTVIHNAANRYIRTCFCVLPS